MAFNGLLQGVMQGIGAGAKAGAKIAEGAIEDKRKLDVFKEMADIEQQKTLLIEKFRSDLGIERKGKELEMEREETVKRGTDKGYLKAEGNLAAVKRGPESSASVAQAALANFQLESARTVQGLQKTLSQTKDPEQRSAISQQIRDLTPNSKGSYADVASVGNGYRMMAKSAAEAAVLEADPEEKKSLLADAKRFTQQADAIFGSVAETKMPGASAPPSSSAAAPHPEGTRLRGKDGNNYVVKNGVPVLSK